MPFYVHYRAYMLRDRSHTSTAPSLAQANTVEFLGDQQRSWTAFCQHIGGWWTGKGTRDMIGWGVKKVQTHVFCKVNNGEHLLKMF